MHGSLRLLVLAIGLFAAGVWGATFVLLWSSDPETPCLVVERAVVATPSSGVSATRIVDQVSPKPRAAAEGARGAADSGGGTTDDAPVAVDALPEDLRKDVQVAIRACWHACERLGLPIRVDDWPRLRPSAARSMARREAALQQELLLSALREQHLLSARLAADSALGIRVPANERGRLQLELQRRYPGWPDGYRFAEDSDGREVRIAAWKVEGDPELAQLVRDHDALTGDYAASVRAGYRFWFHE